MVMMVTNMRNKPRNKKMIIVITIVIALLIAAGLVYIFMPRTTPQSSTDVKDKPVGSVDYTPPADEQVDPALDNLLSTPSANPDDPIPVSFSYVGDSPLQIKVLANELLSSGDCHLSLTRVGATTVELDAKTFPASNYTTCQGFTVDTTSMTKGAWTVTITITSGDRSGTSSTTVEVE